MEWKKIETAPKNKAVLITDGITVRYATDVRKYIDYDKTISHWIIYQDDLDNHNTCVFDRPTHWCELPELPKEVKNA
tara:strand:- start:687 stop:917 length:231 start_codon:yes stop_codon:yes gene_type:complete